MPTDRPRHRRAPCSAVAALLLAALASLAACGGGLDDEVSAETCMVDGRAMPREACR